LPALFRKAALRGGFLLFEASPPGGLNPGNARLKPQHVLDPFRRAKRPIILPVGADDLETEGQAVFSESGRQRYGGGAQQSPRRAKFRVSSEAEAFRRFAEGRQGQDGVEV